MLYGNAKMAVLTEVQCCNNLERAACMSKLHPAVNTGNANIL